jgi:hypothetical protein
MAAILEAGSSRANDVLDRLPEVRAKLVGLGLFPVGTCGADFSGSPRKIEVRWQSAAAEPNLTYQQDGQNTGSPAQFAKLIAEDTEKWAKVIRAANIKVD